MDEEIIFIFPIFLQASSIAKKRHSFPTKTNSMR
jgi:hypothetical protein